MEMVKYNEFIPGEAFDKGWTNLTKKESLISYSGDPEAKKQYF